MLCTSLFLSDQSSIGASEVAWLAAGNFSKEVEEFIRKREIEMRTSVPRISQEYIQHIQKKEEELGISMRKWDFEKFRDALKPRFPHFVSQVLKGSTSSFESKEISYRLPSFPVIRSTIRANLYLDFTIAYHKDSPNLGRIADYRHIIDASYCKFFLSDDSQQLNALSNINENLVGVPWRNFRKKFGEN